MARGATTSRAEPPPPLPRAERPVGQVVAEAIRLYGRRFWLALPLGLPLALTDELSYARATWFRAIALWVFAPLITAAYVGACALAADVRPARAAVVRAFLVGLVVFAAFPPLAALLLIPGLAWLALLGLAVPAALLDGRTFRDALRRGYALGRADFAHALGSLAALTIVYGVGATALVTLLRTQGAQAARAALFLSDLVISPLVFLGAALLYFDQAARLIDSARPRTRRRDADLRAAVDADAAGRADVEVEPGPAARGQP